MPEVPEPLLHLVLYQPEIPQNTGNIGRTCAYAGARLHLIHPLGFIITDTHLRRSGMDYWKSLDVHEHADWEAFAQAPTAPKRRWLLTTHGEQLLWDADFQPGDGLVFGNEGHGAPPWLHAAFGTAGSLRIPQSGGDLRSLNLSTAAGVATFEALRQLSASGHFQPAERSGLKNPDK
ncbi:MAG: tRNA (cytidine(34)-2'-O)-methyltransferase [Opitutales bacterium]